MYHQNHKEITIKKHTAMKNIERASKKYNFYKLGILANMNLVEDIKGMFNSFMDERIAAGKMPESNRTKASEAIRNYLDLLWEQDIKVCHYTLCDLYDYLANGDLYSALSMVQENTIYK